MVSLSNNEGMAQFPMNILAIGAHPDDIEIFMLGTLLAAQQDGATVSMAIATDGAAGGKGDPGELRCVRRAEATAAAELLGLRPHFLDFPDGGLVVDAALIASLKALIADTRPDLVITHAPNDYHGDHRALSDALRIASSFAVPVVWADTMMGVGFAPNIYVDVTDHFAEKCRALRAHSSQDPERFVAMLERWNGFRAAQANATGYAEAFRFEPTYPFVDVRGLLPPGPGARPVKDRRGAE